jgi:cytochrome bd-type quinol oxidase subunit 2
VILPARYPAIVLMVLALVFHGTSFEFRFRAVTKHGRMWLCHSGLGISLWPLIVPPGITIWGCCRTAIQPSLPLDWFCRAASDHPWLHRVRLLGVSGQGAAGDALPLE